MSMENENLHIKNSLLSPTTSMCHWIISSGGQMIHKGVKGS